MTPGSIDSIDAQHWADRLEAMGLAVRARVLEARAADSDLAMPVAQQGGDTIFAIDRHVEPVIERVAYGWPIACKPLLLIAEGLGDDGRKHYSSGAASDGGASGGASGGGGYRLIIDPIDGTRNLMYDKRSAWFLAAVALDRGEATRLSEAFASAIVELPTSKQGFADTFTAVRGGAVRGRRLRLSDGAVTNLPVRPSGACDLRHGFAQVSNFFQGTKVLASELMEHIVEHCMGKTDPAIALVFDDQYISTGGQMVEIMMGRDRFCCDLRPLLYRVLSRQRGQETRGLECHPYDCAGLLAAQQAGVIVTDGLGNPLDAPMDVHTGVHWCGYANQTLRQQIEPAIRQWFAMKGLKSQ